jgi:hypothetical protein
METIKFTTSLINNKSVPWQFNPDDLKGIPETPGVYIVGVKIPVNGQGEKFCPLYVGIHLNLKDRLSEHFINQKLKNTGYLNSKKELFDVSKQPKDFYKDISIMEKLIIRKSKNQQLMKPIAFDEIQNKKGITQGKNTLIWFPDPLFFDVYLSKPSGTSNYPVASEKIAQHSISIKPNGDLDLIHANDSSCGANNLKLRINEAKDIIEKYFFYAFATFGSIDEQLDEIRIKKNETLTLEEKYKNLNYILKEKQVSGKTICSRIESTVKEKLKNKINIHTYGDTSETIDFEIDLSAIQNELVNMTDASFPTKLIL